MLERECGLSGEVDGYDHWVLRRGWYRDDLGLGGTVPGGRIGGTGGGNITAIGTPKTERVGRVSRGWGFLELWDIWDLGAVLAVICPFFGLCGMLGLGIAL